MSVPAPILARMRMTEDTLKRAWHATAAGSDLLDDTMFPPIGTSSDQYPQCADDPEGLSLVLDGDGTVRGYDGPYHEVFATQDIDEVLYFAAEEAVRQLAGRIAARSPGGGPVPDLVSRQAELLDRIDPAWGRRFRGGGTDGAGPAAPCGRDPLERLAWIAGSWRGQDPYTNLAFFRGHDVDAERIALLHGADPGQVASGTRLSDLRDLAGGTRGYWDIAGETYCFGREGDWAFLLYHAMPPGTRIGMEALGELGVTESVRLSACSAKAVYTFDYVRDGRRIDDGGVIELIWYDRGRAPFHRGGRLDFLNQALRRAELDHPEVTDEFCLYFHALETSLGLQLPRRDIQEGTARAAQWARDRT